jgi:cyclophilin family peptidyl-prolyl cis-trans isomerase
MPTRKQTRHRQLSKLAARRAEERRRQQRNRILIIVSALAVAGAAAALLLVVFLTGGKGKPAASPSSSPSASPSASVSPGSQGVACGGTVPAAAGVQKPTFTKVPPMTIDTSKTYTVTMETSCGTIVMQLNPKESPNTVNSLVFLIRKHFFDGLTFHRIVKDFVTQGGDPKGDGTGGPGYSTRDAPPSDAVYPVGTVAMAKGGNDPPGTSGSQFFIVNSPNANGALTNGGPGYAIVGKVISGQEISNKIMNLPATGPMQDQPTQKIYIVSMTVKES